MWHNLDSTDHLPLNEHMRRMQINFIIKLSNISFLIIAYKKCLLKVIFNENEFNSRNNFNFIHIKN